MSKRTQVRSSLRILIGAAIVAVGVVAHPALAQDYCYDGTIAVGTPCPVKTSDTPAQPGATAPTPAPTVPPSGTLAGATAPTVPSAPKLATIAYVSASAVKLTWTAPTSNGGSAITAYLATHSVGGVKGQTYRVAANLLTTQLPCASSMSCGYVLAAENAIGVGPASNYLVASKATR